MAQQPTYGPAQSVEAVDAFAHIAGESFAVSAEEERRWVEEIGPANLRLLTEGEQVIAGLARLGDLAQFHGGRRVPCAGIAGVATDPRLRGKGAGTVLMRAAVQELHRDGIPLAALYPATQPLYRRAGFEQAGGRWEIRARPAALDLNDRGMPLRKVSEADLPELAELHRAALLGGAAGLDRNSFLWRRVHTLFDPARGTAALGAGGAVEGYLFSRVVQVGEGSDLHVSDLVARTPQAATRLLTYLSDHRTQLREVVWHGSPADPLLALLREQEVRVKLRQVWMLRIVDVPAALASRGYPEGLESELHLEIFDEVIQENRGRFVLEVAGGAGRVRPGGEGRLQLHVRGLAPLYSGWLPPESLALTGLLDGDETSKRRARAIFAGPLPAMCDFF